MDDEPLLTPETYMWGLQGICQLHRIPFSAALVSQQFPPPYSVRSLHRAASALGLKSGLRSVRAATLSGLPPPFIAVFAPEERRPDEARQAPVRLVIVTKCDAGNISYFEEGRQHPVVAALDAFATGF